MFRCERFEIASSLTSLVIIWKHHCAFPIWLWPGAGSVPCSPSTYSVHPHLRVCCSRCPTAQRTPAATFTKCTQCPTHKSLGEPGKKEGSECTTSLIRWAPVSFRVGYRRLLPAAGMCPLDGKGWLPQGSPVEQD